MLLFALFLPFLAAPLQFTFRDHFISYLDSSDGSAHLKYKNRIHIIH